ncbi:uncharacterized protein LOC112572072 isoform X2 [Pomacea canaliculata]|uniref:uncharacterized protein LOC112572072 isoform X2 n=1 Tax=Pomacea canaliculata TaxID=400727 RepID=UPI000D73C8E9|nr:uncharacterized protein LOC112572072 isoform X2 [Pomacea canaliculata]
MSADSTRIEGEDSSSDVFSSETSPSDKQDSPSPLSLPKRLHHPLHSRHRSAGSSSESSSLPERLLARSVSLTSQPDASATSGSSCSIFDGRSRKVQSSRNSFFGSKSGFGSISRKDKGGGAGGRSLQGMESVGKNQSFPKFFHRRHLSSSSLPSGLLEASSLSESFSDVYEEDPHLCPGTHAEAASDGRGHGDLASSAACRVVSPSGYREGTEAARSAETSEAKGPMMVRGLGDGVSRCASFSPPAANRLQDLDIVGESFESRFPWQRDVSVQCNLSLYNWRQHRGGSTSSSHSGGGGGGGRLESLLISSVDSGCHSISTSHNPHHLLHQHQQHHSSSSGRASPSQVNTDATNKGSNFNSISGVVRRVNFVRRPRPSSMGALDNTRHQVEVSRFRELITRRGERKSDPQLGVQSPPSSGWRRIPLVGQEEGESVSDLESILEYPDDCLADISRQTSFTSFDTEDDSLRHCDGVFTDWPEPSDYLRQSVSSDVLPSPRLSPIVWAPLDDDDLSDVEASPSIAEDGLPDIEEHIMRFRRATKPPRRLSSGSLTSGSENEGEHEPSPPVARRGRRSAIYETKNCGDVSPTTLSPEHSPSNSCDEGEGASNIAERLRRRRSSVDLAMNIYPGDLLVQEHHKKLIKRNTIADFYAGRNGGPPIAAPPDGTDASKKGRQPFSLLKLMKTRSKENLTKLEDILRRIKPSEFKDNHLAAYKIVHWSDLIASSDKQSPPIIISDTERKRREAVWELFKSECVFLIDHLMVLKHAFMEPLKKVQVEGSLMFTEPQDIFGNLDELCYVSYTFCKDFISALLKDMSVTDFGRTKVLIKAFQRFSTHSKDGAVFHTYCINYTNALTYLEKLRQNPEFSEFERWCEQDPRCNRLQLTDLLVAPMQHCTKLPLLLANIRKYTESETERQMVTESIEKLELSLQQLEEKMKWIKNVERVQEIQRQIVWPTVTDLDPRSVIPDCLKASLSKQPCERLLTCPTRQLLHEGPLTLLESPKPIEVHLFLFDDLLLITKIKKTQRKQKQGGSEGGAKSPSGTVADRAAYVVFRQPLPMDRFVIHDIAPPDASASGLKNVLVLVHISRFQQVIGVFTLQAISEPAKMAWLNHLREAKEKFAEAQSSRQNSFKENRDPKDEEREASGITRSPRRIKRNSLLRKVPAKSRSMDAVFI